MTAQEVNQVTMLFITFLIRYEKLEEFQALLKKRISPSESSVYTRNFNSIHDYVYDRLVLDKRWRTSLNLEDLYVDGHLSLDSDDGLYSDLWYQLLEDRGWR